MLWRPVLSMKGHLIIFNKQTGTHYFWMAFKIISPYVSITLSILSNGYLWCHRCAKHLLIAEYSSQFFSLCIPLAFVECVLKPSQAICLQRFLKSVEENSVTESYIFAGSILLLIFVPSFVTQPVNFGFQKIASKCRILSSNLIYNRVRLTAFLF